jgi:hypothetical protein
MSSYKIELINKSYSISSYLSEKGIHPKREGANKKVYLCPLPDHATDSHPSFYVFDKGDHEDFHCFGCNKSGGIINFISNFEQKYSKEIIRKLGKKLNLDIDSEIDYLILKAKDVVSSGGEDLIHDSLMMSMYISRICNDHMKKCDLDPKEVEVCESFFKVVDHVLMNRDIFSLQIAAEDLPKWIGKRFHSYMDEKEKKELDTYRSWDI